MMGFEMECAINALSICKESDCVLLIYSGKYSKHQLMLLL